MIIRAGIPRDDEALWNICVSAYDSDEEAGIIEDLRKSDAPMMSYVAETEGAMVGFVLFTPVTLEGHEHISIAALGPMAVRNEWQQKGVGAQLMEKGLGECAKAGYKAVVVLGQPYYYARFGFRPSGKYGIECEYDTLPEDFMVKELADGALSGLSGLIKYHPVFNE